MNEACQNLFGPNCDLTTTKGQDFAVKTLNYMRKELQEIQDKTGHYYNLEATPAEGTCYRLNRYRKPEIFLPEDAEKVQAPPHSADQLHAMVEAMRIYQPNVIA